MLNRVFLIMHAQNVLFILTCGTRILSTFVCETHTHTHTLSPAPSLMAGASEGEVICAKASCSVCRAAEEEVDCGYLLSAGVVVVQGGVKRAMRGGVDGLPGWAAADGVPHCEGRRLASRGRAREGVGGGLYRDWRGTAPKVPAGIRREKDRGEGLW